MTLQFDLHKNGSFDVVVQGKPWIYDCYPELDGRPIRPTQVVQTATQITYITEEGNLQLTVHNGQSVAVRFINFQRNVHHFSVCNGIISTAFVGLYQSAGEIGETCGYQQLENMEDALISRGLLALCTDTDTLMMYVKDHTKWHQSFHLAKKSAGEIEFHAQFRLENLRIENEVLPEIYFSVGTDLHTLLIDTAEQIGSFMQARTKQPPAYHWCSWYYNYSEFHENQLQQYLEGFRQVEETKKFHYLQIDAGYSSALGDWLSPRTYWKSGLDTAIQQVNQAGYAPGIWIGPFMVGNHSKLFAEHPDWLLCDLQGNPMVGMCTDNEPRLWGYHDEAYHILDTSHPDAMAYLRGVFREMKQWGVRLFKTDFMLWGYQDSSLVQRHTKGKTSVQYFRDVLAMIREEIGEESYWLGCIAPFFPFIGYADGMRIGGDVGSSWDGQFNPHNMIQSVKGNYFTNFQYYQNDPDAIFFRDFHIRLSNVEIEALALYAALSGGCVYTSDPIHQLRADRLQLMQYIRPDGQIHIPQFPLQQQDRKDLVLMHQGEKATLLLVFNPTEDVLFEEYNFTSLGLQNQQWVTKTNEPAAQKEGSFTLRLQPHGYQLLLLSPDSPPKWHRDNIWLNL